MPPKGGNVLKSQRYAQVMENIKKQKEEAKELLKNLKKTKKKEDKRHKRLMNSAAKLDAKDLMELAGIRNYTLAQVAAFAAECGVPLESPGVPGGAAEAGEGGGGSSGSGIPRPAAPPPPPDDAAPDAAPGDLSD